MPVEFATVRVVRDLPHPPANLFAHWLSPETRVRWEVGPGTNMKYDEFDTRVGATETVRVFNEENDEIGVMRQRPSVIEDGRLIVSSIEAVFGGEVRMLMQITMEFEGRDGGTRVTGTSQIAELTGRDPTGEHTAGWNWILDRFEADVAEHGLVDR